MSNGDSVSNGDRVSKGLSRLSDLEPGKAAIIQEIDGDDSLASRLMEMGLIDGEEIHCIGRAPMGDPTEYSIRGYRLSLRQAEAKRVILSPSS